MIFRKARPNKQWAKDGWTIYRVTYRNGSHHFYIVSPCGNYTLLPHHFVDEFIEGHKYVETELQYETPQMALVQ